MGTAARRLQILSFLQGQGAVDISRLAETMGVSGMTIRRDLALFAKQGIVTTTHGGAVLNKGATIELAYAVKQGQMTEEKQRIGQAAAALVNEGDAVFIDCGTTPAQVAAALVSRRNITVATNSLLAASLLSHASGLKLLMVPGVFREMSMGFIGSVATDYVRRLRFDYLFLGAEGIDATVGATVPDVDDGETKRALTESAREVVVLADHTKLGQAFFFVAAPPERISRVVTGKEAPADVTQRLERSGLQILRT